MITISEIWRHPIKALGRERVASSVLEAGKCLPWDRAWAVAHSRGREANDTEWAHCRNFIRAASAPALMAIDCQLDEMTGHVTLTHPERANLTVDPIQDQDALIDWVAPLLPENRPAPARVVRVPGRGMTDSGTPGLTIANLASHRAVEQKLGRPLSRQRWRANLWLDGAAPWEEFDWVDKTLRIGEAVIEVYGRTERCRATEANPDTGVRDADTLGTLRSWDHQDFSVKAKVIEGGLIREGDVLEVIR